MATFGDTGVNVVQGGDASDNYIYARKFALAEAGTVTKLGGRFGYDTRVEYFRLVLYDDDGTNNYPGTLLGVTAEITTASDWAVTDDIRWYDITPVALDAGNYWIGEWNSDNIYIARGSGTGGLPSGNTAKTYHATNSPGNLSAWTYGDIGTWRLAATYTVASSTTPLTLLRPRFIPSLGGH